MVELRRCPLTERKKGTDGSSSSVSIAYGRSVLLNEGGMLFSKVCPRQGMDERHLE